MPRSEKQEITRRPEITRDTQSSVWRLGDSLVRALHEPEGDQPGDARWTVGGISYSSWSISHPDLEILESGDSPLILRIKRINQGRWAIFGQNLLKNLLNTKTLSIQKSPPNNSWDIDFISKKAANYFREQKQKILELKQAMTPQQTPGAGQVPTPPAGGGQDMGMPMASRRAAANLRNLQRAERIAHSMNRAYGRQEWYRGAQVVNDRHGIGLVVRLEVAPGGRLQGTLGGIPVDWQGPQGRRWPVQTVRTASRKSRRWVAEVFDPPVTEVDPDEQEHREHEERVRRVYKHLLEHRRAYSSVKYLASVLGMDPHQLSRALGELMVQGKIDITNKKFKPVPPQREKVKRVHLNATTSMFRKDQGNWRHDDQLQTTSPAQFQVFSSPEEELADSSSRIMPDPLYPN
jgi:hypothetical protein